MDLWIEKREAAQWILREMLHNVIKENWNCEFLVTEKGEIDMNLDNVRHRYAESQLPIRYLIEKDKYTSEIIYAAIRLLQANNHIEESSYPENKGIEEILFKATPEGVKASENDFYKNEILEKWKDWPERYWPLVVVIGFVFGSILTPIALEEWKTYRLKQSQSETGQQPLERDKHNADDSTRNTQPPVLSARDTQPAQR